MQIYQTMNTRSEAVERAHTSSQDSAIFRFFFKRINGKVATLRPLSLPPQPLPATSAIDSLGKELNVNISQII